MTLTQPGAASIERAAPRRNPSLDGIRGIAALVVVVCHVLLVQPGLANAYFDPATVSRYSLQWWLGVTPVHLGWAGAEAVYLFFVLSGFVLVLPFAGGRGSWLGYYPKRLLRLYVPVWGSLVLALAWITALPRDFSASGNWWLQGQQARGNVAGELMLFPGPHATNPVLWSLQLEVVFSLLLPAYILFGRAMPRLNAAKFVLLLAVSMLAAGRSEYAFYLPMFGLGVIMALERERLQDWGRRIAGRPRPFLWWLGLTSLCLVLMNGYWTVRSLTGSAGALAVMVPVVRGLTLCGACLAIFIALCGPWDRFLGARPLAWLGRRSFSLYLVHHPVVLAAVVILGGSPGIPATLAVAAPASLLLAELFYRLVERPSQLLSRRAGALALAQGSPLAAQPTGAGS